MKYCYQGITYQPMNFEYKDYHIRFEVYKEGNIWHACVDSYKDMAEQIIFRGRLKRDCWQSLVNWFKDTVDEGKVQELIRKGWCVRYEYEPVLKDTREILVGYHITVSENASGIKECGLLPNGNPEQETINASRLIDRFRPPRLPDWLVRSKAVYAAPWTENEVFTKRSDGIGNFLCKDIFAVRLQPEFCWVGSQGIGGFCLHKRLPQDTETRKELFADAKKYWKNSVSLAEYIENAPNVQRIDNRWGLDEVLVLHPLPSSAIVWLGHWDTKGVFCESEHFKDFVKDQFKDSYRQILGKY